MADELRVRLLAEDRLSSELKDAQKSVRDLKKELIAAAREAESSGDFSKVKQLEKSYEDAQRSAGKLRAELKQLQRESKTTGDATVKSAGMMRTAWSKLQKVMSNPLVTAVSLGALTLFAKSAIQSFSEVQDASDALTATFGDSGQRMIDWANQSALSFNLSQKEALNAAQTMAVFGDSAGLAGQELETFAISLTERAADAASFFGGTTQDAITAFGSAMRGEMEPIRKYGVLLDDATLRMKAMEMGIISTTKQALTPQQRTLAAYNAVMDQTTRVQGDVARTQDSMANQIKQSQAQMENFKTTVGETLAVGLNPILKVLNGLMGLFNTLPGPIKTVAIAVGLLGVAALVMGPRIAMMAAEMRAAGVSATGMAGKMKGAAMFLGGPWGAALAVATIALTHFLMEQAEANARIDQFASNIDNVTGKLNAAGVQGIVETLLGDISEDDWRTLEGMGITVEDATNAILSGEEAWRAYQDRLNSIGVTVMGTGTRSIISTLQNNMHGLRSEVERGERVWRATTKAQEIAANGLQDVEQSAAEAADAYRESQRSLFLYRKEIFSATHANRELRDAQRDAATASERLAGGLDQVNAALNRKQTMQAYRDALAEFISNPSDETADSVISAMTTAASAIEEPREQAEFTKTAIDSIKGAAQDAGLKLNPALEAALDAARGKAKLLETQIDRAVRARTVEITLRYSDSRATYGGERKAIGGWIGGNTGGPTSDTVPVLASRGEYVLRGGAAAALRQAIGDAGMWQLNHADRAMPDFMSSPVPQFVTTSPGKEPVAVGASSPVIHIGEIKAESGVDVQAEVLWAMRRADRIRRERGA